MGVPDRLKQEWKEICKDFDRVPNGQNLKTRHQFSRNDLIQIVAMFRKRNQEMEELVHFEQVKNR